MRKQVYISNDRGYGRVGCTSDGRVSVNVKGSGSASDKRCCRNRQRGPVAGAANEEVARIVEVRNGKADKR